MQVRPLVWDEKLVIKFWDYYSHHPEKYFTYQFGNSIVKELGKDIRPGARVLDYGCGTGFLINYFLEKGFDVYGTDTSKQSLAFVAKQYKDHPSFKGVFLLEELLNLGEKFDVIYVVEVIEHLDDEFLFPLLENVKKLVVPGGKIVFTTPNAERLEDSEVYCPVCDHTFHRWQHVRSWTTDSIKKVFEARGLRVLQSYGFDFTNTSPKGALKKLKQSFRNYFYPPGKPHLIAVCTHS